IQVDKEIAYLAEDQGFHGAATKAWKGLVERLLPLMKKDPRFKEQYYECYCNYISSFYKYTEKLTDAKKKQEYLQRIANMIVKLEETQPDMGGEKLKKRYDD